MSFQTKSLSRQWKLWLAAALVSVFVYVVVAFLLFGAEWHQVLQFRQQRVAIPLLVLFFLFAWETRWDGTRQEEEQGQGSASEPEKEEEKEEEAKEEEEEAKKEEASLSCGGEGAATPLVVEKEDGVLSCGGEGAATPLVAEEEGVLSCGGEGAATPLEEEGKEDETVLSGEELYEKARTIPHAPIPDFEEDAIYLDLLGSSVSAGYAPAMAKLGEYAMRREAWVEAYYWMFFARHNGMLGLEPVLRGIRQSWVMSNYPDQWANVTPLFTEEAGSIGRALLHVDSGHEAAQAREYLRENYPELLE